MMFTFDPIKVKRRNEYVLDLPEKLIPQGIRIYSKELPAHAKIQISSGNLIHFPETAFWWFDGALIPIDRIDPRDWINPQLHILNTGRKNAIVRVGLIIKKDDRRFRL